MLPPGISSRNLNPAVSSRHFFSNSFRDPFKNSFRRLSRNPFRSFHQKFIFGDCFWGFPWFPFGDLYNYFSGNSIKRILQEFSRKFTLGISTGIFYEDSTRSFLWLLLLKSLVGVLVGLLSWDSSRSSLWGFRHKFPLGIPPGTSFPDSFKDSSE